MRLLCSGFLASAKVRKKECRDFFAAPPPLGGCVLRKRSQEIDGWSRGRWCSAPTHSAAGVPRCRLIATTRVERHPMHSWRLHAVIETPCNRSGRAEFGEPMMSEHRLSVVSLRASCV